MVNEITRSAKENICASVIDLVRYLHNFMSVKVTALNSFHQR